MEPWTGQSALVSHPNALNGVSLGFLPFHKKRGVCTVLCLSVSLWFFVSEALGYLVTHAQITLPLFKSSIQTMFPAIRFPAKIPTMDLMFAGFNSPPQTPQYWLKHPVPHLVLVVGSDYRLSVLRRSSSGANSGVYPQLTATSW